MRERSHKKGEIYQQDAKHWLIRSGFIGFDADLFGDAYDVTRRACTIGGIVFDFSLKLRRGELARHILYGECKYRDERRGNVNTDFKEFLKRVYEALSGAEADDADNAHFVFLSNIPPDDWREFLRNKRSYCEQQITWKPDPPDGQVLDCLIERAHLLTLSAQIIRRA